ncbi:hypothetical protein BDF20DRAFT_898099 [Mycotypha africana]|uniref:uncharacterized protein n=1 Tax=Mycotypha africana TaxID=64632 RepID=UPI002300DAEF|nr:uncharacterized protein BDF20DRAFT_898099 [Mycotypha africana]KAI8967958.1 hypothetical protein BDF20DRAFT_898099 [Mycotypha africana]
MPPNAVAAATAAAATTTNRHVGAANITTLTMTPSSSAAANNNPHAMTTPPMTTTATSHTNTNLAAPMFYNNSSTASLPNLYSSSNHAWSSSETHLVTPQMTPYSSTEELSKQEFGGSKSDDEETSSGMEDDIDFHQTSPMNGPYFDANAHNRQTHQALMATELYPVGLQNSDTHFDPNLMNSWNNMKYAAAVPPHASMINGGNMDPNNLGNDQHFLIVLSSHSLLRIYF